MNKTPVILLAEDDENVLLALKDILSRKICCDIVAVKDGQLAWDKIKSGCIDIIISDWNMPNKTGDELLLDVREDANFRYTPFIMITARSDKDSVITAVQSGVTSYISKPFSNREVVEKVKMYVEANYNEGVNKNKDTKITIGPASSGAVKKNEFNINKEVDRCLKDSNLVFPVLPDVAFKVTEEINGKKTTADNLTNIIKSDASLTARLISVSNSLYFKGNKAIDNLQDAIVRLGLKETENIVMMFSQKGMVNTSNPLFEKILKQLCEHAFATAICAREIAKHIKQPQIESYFTIGLLHDVGKLLLLKILIDLDKKGHEITEEMVYQVFEAQHERSGGMMLRKWGFPIQFILAASAHHDLSANSNDTTTALIINTADQLVRKLGLSMTKESATDVSEIESAKKLMISSKNINEILLKVEEDYNTMAVVV